MIKFEIIRTDGTFEVLLLKHKGTETYSFVNLTKGHICPCIFNSIQEAIDDLDRYIQNGRIITYKATL